VAILITWIFGLCAIKWETWYWPWLGFFFAPATTFTYQLCMYYGQLQRITDSPLAMVFLTFGALNDVGQLGMLKAEKDE
jgi:hypothetical protein